ncbi:Sensor histidine kinase DesK [Streptomyces sp. ADI96-02]|uniref:sensor histidine kinase n=1 Tax=Streptomyces sp. ADI96-02 TaxID=1522760 RepID=UPI000F558AD5|nr:histidine kinase [Streptomyces sp. ADI96-02]RPK61774.1 Sensor histidine kinase DesK [Streptomyces sp. ADI96-02]
MTPTKKTTGAAAAAAAGGLRWPGRKPVQGDPAKAELYTRFTFQALAGTEAGVLGVPLLLGDRQPVSFWLFLLMLAHSVMTSVVATRALEWQCGRRERPVTLMAASAALSGGAVLTLLVLLDAGTIDAQEDGFGLLLMGIAAFGLGTFALCQRTTRQRVGTVLVASAGTAAATALLGLGWRQTWLDFVGVAAAGSLFVVSYVFSAWLVGVVRELEATREIRTRLAVAEERLRFGRDIHDVLGRNLAVMALKSELAVQLAERGRPEAVPQMAEVQRIAQESQREIREVVRGYREADLQTELAGAQGVLRAAGIACEVRGLDVGRADPDAEDGLPPEVRSALGWVVREATTNVLRHGDPARCTIRLSSGERDGTEGGTEVTLTVENDGAGPTDGAEDRAGAAGAGAEDATGAGAGDADADRTAAAGAGTGPGRGMRRGRGTETGQGTGLAGLRDRLALLDGTLEAGATGRKGHFRLTARIPVPEPRTDGGDRTHVEGAV